MPSGYSNALYEMDEMNPFGLKKYKERVNYAKNTTLPLMQPKIIEARPAKPQSVLENTLGIMVSRYEIEVDTSLCGFLTYKWSVSGAAVVSGGRTGDKYIEVQTAGFQDVSFTVSCTATDQKQTVPTSKSFTHHREMIPIPIVISSLIEGSAGTCQFLSGGECTASSTYSVSATGHEPLSYEWIITGGTITSGQGTTDVTVETTAGADTHFNVRCDIFNEYERKSISTGYSHLRSEVIYSYDRTVTYDNTNIATEFATFV